MIKPASTLRFCSVGLVAALAAHSTDAQTQLAAVPDTTVQIVGTKSAPDARIGVGDSLTVRAGLWDAVTASYTEWAGISGTVQVQPDGYFMFPMAGRIPAAGRDPADVADALAEALHSSSGSASAPSVSVEIGARPPVTVSGHVMTPGDIVYRPGLTVRQAVAMAGGVFRTMPDGEFGLFAREARTREGLLRVDLRIARLEAELDEATDFTAPANLGTRSDLVAIERQIMQARAETLADRTKSIDTLIDVLNQVADGLVRQSDLIAADIARAEEDAARRQDLLDRGLARANDLSSAEARLSGLRLREIDLTTQRLTLEQDLSKARERRDALRQDMKLEILNDLSAARDRRRDLELEETLVSASRLDSQSGPVSLRTSRVSADDPTPRAVQPETPLNPGDTLIVATAND
ncbi:Polysaccharide biosynthesis/export protein [Rhodobacteraceae bacterium THAF1]|uniref:polysaccharide biosynthesis/export family protein n=1 Tax=Palleronia sp. THAF1 TaxID=2587842 RepID=UPI000F3EBDF1|nr:polysaccharide biosynthesis/export family protein [Palleronia sp. THAF1]QFU10341.1 Polysaccharide biosynthesis/export protein [Palleronia sp. THAF1]VDC31459.1 Polysaccharide biosynthesis/export protein [Rhodobacteraceae bacterium THAF1]